MNKLLYKIFLVMLFCMGGGMLKAQLNGSYTINSAVATGGTNYQTFTAAINALTAQGVSGPVTFDVSPTSGPYNERLVFGAITGASATNRIRFNGNGRLVQFAPTSTATMSLLTLNATNYVTIDSLKFQTTNTTYGWGAWITGNSQYDSIMRCEFDLSVVTGTSSTNSNGIVIGGNVSSPTNSALGGTNNVIIGNYIKGNPSSIYGHYYSMCVSPGGNINNSIINNTFENFYVYGIYLGSVVDNIKIIGNNINRATKTSTSTFYGIYASGSMPGAVIAHNRIHTPGGTATAASGTSYGLYAQSSAGTLAAPVLIYNNAYYNVNTLGSTYGMYFTGVTYGRIYHNTVDINRTHTGTNTEYGMYLATNSNAIFKNNNVSFTGGGLGLKYGVYYASSASALAGQIQRNNINMNSPQAGGQFYCYYNGSDYPTLSAFRTAVPTLEIGSMSVNPYFQNANAGNLLPTNGMLYQNGENLLGAVPTDILGTTRATLPTAGAWEMSSLPNNDAAMIEKVSTNII